MGRHTVRSCFLLTLCGLSLAAASPAAAADATAWELSPYEVHLVAGFENGAAPSAAFEEQFLSDLVARVKAATGGAWTLIVEKGNGEHSHAADSSGQPAEDKSPVAEQSGMYGGDKTIHLNIQRTKSGFRAVAQDFDESVSVNNAPVTRDCYTASALAREAASAVLAAFAPLAMIENVQGDTVRLRLKAAALIPRDSPLAGSNTVFRPLLVKSSTDGRLTVPTEVVPWTYLVPAGSTGGRVTCRIVTGLEGVAIPDYHPHRQRLAIGVSHSSSSTKLKIVTDDGQSTPQEGYEVVEEVVSADGKSTSLTRVGGSGADGIVVVPPGNEAVRMLLVRHGDITLARLPLVPGLVQEVTLPLPPAGQRVAIASALASLEDDLIDRLARQQVLDNQIAALTTAGDTAAADKLRGQLRGLPAKTAFTARLAEQETALAAADATAQRLLASKIAAIKKVVESLP